MRVKLPITGTVREVKPHVSGDLDDPIRLININLGNVSWRLISLDIDAEEMEIEVLPSESFEEDTGEINEEGKPIWVNRSATPEDKETFLEYARNHSLERMSKDALYALSGSPRLKNPFKVEP